MGFKQIEKLITPEYINNLELTEKVFIPDPFCVGSTMYKTGDIGRWNEGNIEYFGREDNQIKIHGIRIELEEIENRMLDYEFINQAIVIAIGDDDKRIIAYYSSEGVIDSVIIYNYLLEKLPKSMIPVEFIFIEKIPFKQNGKVDRNKLEILSKNKGIMDSECNEIMKIIKDVIGREINEDDNFSQSDVDSITFIKIIVALESAFDFEFDDEMLLITKYPTVKFMIKYVESRVNKN